MPRRVPAPARPPAHPPRYDNLAARYDRIAELLDGPLLHWLRAQLHQRAPDRRGPDSGGPGGGGTGGGGPVGWSRGRRALDLGCGTGLHTQLLADHYGEVLAVDHSTAMLQHARRRRHRPAVTYRHGDLRHVTPAEDGRFDLVLASRVLHEIPDLDADPVSAADPAGRVDGVLRSIRDLVRPGGRVLLVDLVHPASPADPVGTRLTHPPHTARHPAPPFRAPERAGYGPPFALDPRRPLDRDLARSAARRGWWQDLRHRRRPVGERLELLRLLLDPNWLDHAAATAVWPAPDWHRRCLAVFPGARVTALPGPLPYSPSSSDPPCGTHALAWTAPEPL